jgi:hypothetical protein
LRDLDASVEPTAPGDLDSPLRWSCKSVRTLAVALQALGHSVSHTVVAELLHGLGYSLQANVKTREGRQHPDRVRHFPPGTSKWNKIEHRLFSHIAMNSRGTPLVSLAAIVSLIGPHTAARACTSDQSWTGAAIRTA